MSSPRFIAMGVTSIFVGGNKNVTIRKIAAAAADREIIHADLLRRLFSPLFFNLFQTRSVSVLWSVKSDHKTETDLVWNRLKNKGLKSRRNKSAWIISLSAAAAAIFLIVTFLFPPTKIEVTPIAINRGELIKPGTRQATLILNDGSVHDLTATKNLVLNDGGTEIKSEGAKLEYTEKESAPSETMYNTLRIPRGGEFFLQLADGTKVWLNSETVLRYPVQFDGNERRV